MNSDNKTTTAGRLPTPAEALAAVAGMLDTAAVRRWLFGHLHGGRSLCPACGVEVAGRAADTFWIGGRVRCKGCGSYFTATTATAFSKAKLTDEQLFLLLAALGLNLDIKTTAVMIGINPSSIRENRQKIEKLLHEQEPTP